MPKVRDFKRVYIRKQKDEATYSLYVVSLDCPHVIRRTALQMSN